MTQRLDAMRRITSQTVRKKDAIDHRLTPIEIRGDRGSAAGRPLNQEVRLRGRFGTNARNRRGLSTVIRCRTSSFAPAAFNLGRKTVSVFA